MQPAQLRKRVELQIGHIHDMVKEQNRMVLAEIEPTDSERKDMLILLSEIKANVELHPWPRIPSMVESYTEILGELAELGYNTGPYKLAAAEESRSEGSVLQRSGNAKVKKQVHFEDQSAENEDDANSAALAQQQRGSPSDTDAADEPSSRQIYDQNDLLLEDQDRRLLEIGNSVSRQRAMGETINTELGLHNNLLEDVEAQVDHSQGRLGRLTNGVKTFNRKSRECGTCSTILVLVLILFIVLII